MAETKVGIIIEAKDKASRQLREIGGNIENVNSRSRRLAPSFKKLATVGAVAFGALAVAVGGVIKATANFESQLGDISTLISGDSTKAIGKLRTGILELTKTIPKSAEDLGASAYAIMSSGVSDAADVLKVLKSSGKLAVAGLSTTEQATDLLTTALNAFGKDASESDAVADILFKTVKAGKTTVADMSQSFGKMAGNAAAAGVSLVDVQAATAAITTVTGKTSEAQNALAQVFLELTVKGGKLDKALQDQGSSLDELNKEVTGGEGLVAAFQGMKRQLGITDTEFKNMFSSAEGGTAVFQLLTSANKAFITTQEDMLDGAPAIEEAFKKQTAQFDKQWQLLKNNLNVEMMNFGNKILPTVTDALTKLNDLGLSGVIDKFKNLGTIVSNSISQFDEQTGIITIVRDAFNDIALVIKENLLPAFVGWWEAIQPLKPFLKILAKVVGVGLAIAFTLLVQIIKGLVILIIQLNIWVIKVATFFGNVWVKSIGFVIDKLSDLFNWIEKVIDAFKRMNIVKNVKAGANDIATNVSAGAKSVVNIIKDALPFAEGGIVTRPTLAMIGEGGQPEAVIPLSKLNSIGGGGVTVNINGGNFLSEDAGVMLGDQIIERLKLQMRI